MHDVNVKVSSDNDPFSKWGSRRQPGKDFQPRGGGQVDRDEAGRSVASRVGGPDGNGAPRD
eukprot:5975949-Lingulodinium_polyedra.AAC.1